MADDRSFLRELFHQGSGKRAPPPSEVTPRISQVEIYSTTAFDDKHQIIRLARAPSKHAIPYAGILLSIWFDKSITTSGFNPPLSLGFKVSTYEEVTKKYQTLKCDGDDDASWEAKVHCPPPIEGDVPFRVSRYVIPVPEHDISFHERVVLLELNKITSYLYQDKFPGISLRIELIPEKWSKIVYYYHYHDLANVLFLEQYFSPGFYHGHQRQIRVMRASTRKRWLQDHQKEEGAEDTEGVEGDEGVENTEGSEGAEDTEGVEGDEGDTEGAEGVEGAERDQQEEGPTNEEIGE